MRNRLRWMASVTACLVAVGCVGDLAPDGSGKAVSSPSIAAEPGPNPWTHLDFDDDPANFSFAIVTDLQGGYRAGVFEAAVDRLNWMRPEFVLSVGDLIPGYSEDVKEIQSQWDWFDGLADGIDAPFFYTPGNHDFSNEVMAGVWLERHGRDYYHFVYRDVLFLILNTEEPPVEEGAESRAFFAEFRKLLETDRAAAVAMLAGAVDGTVPGIHIGDEQVAYFEDVISRQTEVRWTILLMHKPAFQGDGDPQYNRIAASLGDRPHTSFAGHVHNYRRFEMGPRVHYRLGTTGGGPIPLPVGNMDHIVWVTMSDDGPVLANLLLDGILDDRGLTTPGARLWPGTE